MQDSLWGRKAFAWSPDGKQIAMRLGTSGVLSLINTDGSGEVRLACGPADGVGGFLAPAWSPDGKELAFPAYSVMGSSPEDGIFAIDVTRGCDGKKRLTATRGERPSWSPDGERIAFMTAPYQGDPMTVGLMVMNADGSRERLLRRGAILAHAWSPDSKTIAFSEETPAAAGVSFAVNVMNADGSGQLAIASAAHMTADALRQCGEWVLASGLSWSLDSRNVVASQCRDSKSSIVLAAADGSEEHRVTAVSPK